MAWTAPRTWTNGELVTDTIMNPHVKDNLRYLKGLDGTVAFDAGVTVAGAMAATGAVSGVSGTFAGTGGTVLTATGSATTTTINVTSPNVASQNAVLQLTNTGQRVGQIIMDRANDKLRLATNTGAQPAVSIDATGQVGVCNTITPQGPLHSYGTISGVLHWEASTVGASATVIPNAAGDVIRGLVGQYVCRESTGGVQGGTISLRTPGGASVAISADGALTIAVAANGSVSLTRSVGTATYDVVLWLVWL